MRPPSLRILHSAFLLCTLSLSVAAQPAKGRSQFNLRALKRIDKVVAQEIRDKQVPGAVVVIGSRDQILYQKAFGFRTLGPAPEAMTLDTIFDMASLTKATATATSILILAERGQLSLNDKVVKYLPEFKEKDNVTLKHLLTHYSGLRPDLDLKETWSGYDTALQLAFKEKLQVEPGTRFIYSDINYVVLTEIVRIVSGQTLDLFSRENIFVPLGMTDTGFLPPESKRSRIAPTETRSGALSYFDPSLKNQGEPLRGEVHDPTAYRMGGVAGHAGLFSTARDMSIYSQMILNGGVYRGARILSSYAVLAMTTAQNPEGTVHARGYGWDINTSYSAPRGDFFPVGSFGHTGFTGTSLWMDPHSGVFVLILTSRLYPDGKGNVTSLRSRVGSVAASAVRMDIGKFYK
jgi:CubicO group peptidase (beta-lactamase class C family)